MTPKKILEAIIKNQSKSEIVKKVLSERNKEEGEQNLLNVINELIKIKEFNHAFDLIKILEDESQSSTELNILKIDVLKGQKRDKEVLDVLHQLINLEAFPNEKIALVILRKIINVGKYEHASLYIQKYIKVYENYEPAWPYILRVALQVADFKIADDTIKKLKLAHSKKNSKIYETPRTHLLWNDDQQQNNKVVASFSANNYPSKDIPRPSYDNKKIRIGYISYDFRDHPTTLLFMGLLRHHNQDLFDLHAYCLSYDDGSAIRRDLQSRFKFFNHVQNWTDEKIADKIKEDQIDILVDLNGLTEGTRFGVFSYRPAGVIISYLGFPGSVGNRFIDYIIGDNYTITDDLKKYYPEKVIRIPWTYQINDYRARYLPPKSSKPPHKLLSDGPILGMFNNINKTRAECWDLWIDIMNSVRGSQLWVLDPGSMARRNILNYCEEKKFDQSRIIFVKKMKQEAHIKRLQWCDLMLDPWPYGGHTTTADAIFCGVPVVTLSGNNFASRVSAGLLKAAYMDDFVAYSKDDYKKIVLQTLSNLEDLREKKQKLINKRMSLPIFDSVKRTIEIERAYIEIHKRQKAKDSFVNINIK